MADDLLQALQTKLRLLDAVNAIGKSLTASLDLREVLTTVIRRIQELQQPRLCAVLLEREGGTALQVEVALGGNHERFAGMRVAWGEGIGGECAAQQKSLLITDGAHDPRVSEDLRLAFGHDLASIIAVPLIARRRVLGVVELINGPEDRPFTRDDVQLVEMLAEFAAIGIENARSYQRIEELTILDEHTALYNSRFLYRSLEVEVMRSRRFSHPLSVIFLDLDHFKRVNDTHGHAAGTALLAEVGRTIQGSLRAVDIPVRYGGDEFVIVLPETGKAAAIEVTTRLRAAITRRVFLRDRQLAVRVTGSFGVASFPDDANTAEDLLKAADAAMYSVKSVQRDGIAAASVGQVKR